MTDAATARLLEHLTATHGAKNTKPQRRGTVDGKDLLVASKDVKAPVKLRYLHSRPWFGALYNDACLPLGAFEVAK